LCEYDRLVDIASCGTCTLKLPKLPAELDERGILKNIDADFEFASRNKLKMSHKTVQPVLSMEDTPHDALD
jgi:hypothetical protein